MILITLCSPRRRSRETGWANPPTGEIFELEARIIQDSFFNSYLNKTVLTHNFINYMNLNRLILYMDDMLVLVFISRMFHFKG
jgi:hypothetical protein